MLIFSLHNSEGKEQVAFTKFRTLPFFDICIYYYHYVVFTIESTIVLPDANKALRGMITGLSLGTTASMIFKALAEATIFGTKKIIDRFIDERIQIKGIIFQQAIKLFLDAYQKY